MLSQAQSRQEYDLTQGYFRAQFENEEDYQFMERLRGRIGTGPRAGKAERNRWGWAGAALLAALGVGLAYDGRRGRRLGEMGYIRSEGIASNVLPLSPRVNA